jgi:arylsulfatase A-like enzyme
MNNLPALVLVLTFAPCAALNAAEPQKPAAKPNIVYLLADQWRGSATGYAGDPVVKTPNLDRLAKEALNFRNAVSVCPVCTPYRASLMTGRYPTSTGMFLNDAHLPDEEVCFAEAIRPAGYTTGYIGKWHLDGHGRGAFIPSSRRQGWEYWKGAECDHNYNHSHYYTGDSGEKQFWNGYDAFAQTRDAQQYIRDHARGAAPFMLMVSYGTPHFPHNTAPEEYKALYPPDKIQLPPNVPEELQDKARKEAQGYYAHCTALDKCVGDVLQTVAETGIAENTIVVFTSDHGEMLGSHGCPPLMKQVAWSESSRVPFLLRYPAVHGRQGRVVDTPLTTPDIMPTLLGLAGVAIPGSVEGESLSAVVREGREIPGRAALYMGVAPFVAPAFAKEYRAVRTRQHTYVRSLEGPWLLFDNEQDPHQLNNLAAKPECASLCEELDGKLNAELKRIGDDFRPARAYIAEWGYEIAEHGSVAYSDKEMKVQTPRRKTATGSR